MYEDKSLLLILKNDCVNLIKLFHDKDSFT